MSDEFYMPGLSHLKTTTAGRGAGGCFATRSKASGGPHAGGDMAGPFCRDYAVEDAEAFFALSEEGWPP